MPAAPSVPVRFLETGTCGLRFERSRARPCGHVRSSLGLVGLGPRRRFPLVVPKWLECASAGRWPAVQEVGTLEGWEGMGMCGVSTCCDGAYFRLLRCRGSLLPRRPARPRNCASLTPLGAVPRRQAYVKGEKGWAIVSGEGTDQEVSQCLNCAAVGVDFQVGPYEQATKQCRSQRRQTHGRGACQHPDSEAKLKGRKPNARTLVRP